MRTIAVISRKGGSGKTTVATSLAIAGFLRGQKVCLADTDPQRSALEVLKMRDGEGPMISETSGPKLFPLQQTAARACDLMVIDTPATVEDGLAHALNLADLCLLVVRPTFLDLAAAARTTEIVRRLGRKGLAVINQAPVARAGRESPAVVKAVEALRFLGLPLAPVILRHRAIYQSAANAGRSAEEFPKAGNAAAEIAALWAAIQEPANEMTLRRA
ncbi:MAG: AAA family ATPase [Caulobacteraceae bacterium]